MMTTITEIGHCGGWDFARLPSGDIAHRANDAAPWRFYCTATSFNYTIAGQYLAGNTAPMDAAKGMINGIVAQKDRR